MVTNTNDISSKLEKLFSQSAEGLYYLGLGKLYFDGVDANIDYEKSWAYFLKAAISCGNPEAFFYLGNIYKKGMGVRSDNEMAFSYFHQGAELLHPESLIKTVDCFNQGIGVDKDETKELQSYIREARTGHRIALRKMGNCFWHGIGTEVNFVQSARYTRLAASAGADESLIYFGVNILYGRGEKKIRSVQRRCFE